MLEDFELQQHKEEPMEKIKEALLPEGKDILEKDEEEIDDGLGVFMRKKTLYHGSAISGIKKFNKAEEDTVGSGIYFNPEAKDAIDYAIKRSEEEPREQRAVRQGSSAIENPQPIIYETSVENIKLLDLRKDENVERILEGFKVFLEEKQSILEKDKPDRNWHEGYEWYIEKIANKEFKKYGLKLITAGQGKLFSDYIKSLDKDYEGLIVFEGKEKGEGDAETYLIFDPEKVKIIQEHNINIE